MVRVLLAIGLLAAVAWFPTVAGQVAPEIVLRVEGVATGTANTDEPVYVEPFRLMLSARYIICSSASEFQFEVAPAASPVNASSNQTVAFEWAPRQPNITVPAGPHVVAAYVDDVEVVLQIRPASIPAGGLVVPVTIGAALASEPAECEGNGPIRASAEPVTYTIRFGRPPLDSSPPEMPGPGIFLAAVAIAFGFAFTRRRRG